MRHGIEIIYHASFTDEEALDMLEANRDRHFVAPGIGILFAMLDHAAPWGITRQKAVEMGYEIELAAAPSRSARCTSAASASCPAATTASPSRPTARTPGTWSSS